MADRLAERRGDPVAQARSKASASGVIAGGTAVFAAADLADLDSVAGLAETAEAADALINNAGSFG